MRFADAPDVLTVGEAAELARVGRNQMYQAVARGDVWSARIGKSIRVPKVALAAYLHLIDEAVSATNTPTAQENRNGSAIPRRAAS